MANYQTHETVGVAATSLAATLLYSTGHFHPDIWMISLIFGAVGANAPDIDLDSSKILKFVFKVLTYLVVSATIYKLVNDNFTIIKELGSMFFFLLIIALTYVINCVIVEIFKRYTKHRGVFHTIQMGVLLHNIVILFLVKVYNYKELDSRFIGLVFLIGFIVHLILDEIYSVDFENNKLKKSFMTALKVTSFKSRRDFILSLIVLVLAILTFAKVPNPTVEKGIQFNQWMISKDPYLTVKQRFLPSEDIRDKTKQNLQKI